MSWTTIWSHAQRGIAQHSKSNSSVQIVMRQITSVDKIRLVFANEYGKQTQHIQNFSFQTNERCQSIPDFCVSPGDIYKTESISIDPEAKKWQISFETRSTESGFAYNDADFLAKIGEHDFCSGLIAIEAEIEGECIVALGDSLTEDATWTAPIQRKFRANNLFFVNQGINGSCLLKSSSDRPTDEANSLFYGYDSVKRLKFCLASHSNVSKVILFLGSNDLINGELTLACFQEMIKNLIQLCKDHNVEYQLCTLTPSLGYPGMDQSKEDLRREINRWLVSNYNEVWDFSAIVEEHDHLRTIFDSGDHLHFNAAAGLAIARQISSDFVKGE